MNANVAALIILLLSGFFFFTIGLCVFLKWVINKVENILDGPKKKKFLAKSIIILTFVAGMVLVCDFVFFY